MEAVNPQKIKRERMQVVIYTQDHRVEGEVHTPPSGRLTDFINSRPDQSFIAMTNAKIHALSEDKLLYTVDFLAINKNHMLMIFPTTSLK